MYRFGVVLIANEIPFMPIQRHFPTLSHYDGKGFFLIFVSTFVFSGSASWRQSDLGAERYLGWLTGLLLRCSFGADILLLGHPVLFWADLCLTDFWAFGRPVRVGALDQGYHMSPTLGRQANMLSEVLPS